MTTKAITPSPAWTNAQLSAPAGDNWLEYYGSLTGDRYSSLNQITTSNVSTLKQVWQMSLGTCTRGHHRRRPRDSRRTDRGSQQPDELRFDGVEPRRGRRRALHDQRSSRPGLRDRCGDRQHHLDLHALVRRRDPEQRNRLHARQRRSPPRRRGRRGPRLQRASGRPPRRARPDHRQAGVGDLDRVVQEQREDLQRPDLRQRHGPRRRRLGRQRRQQPVDQAFRAANGARIWAWSPIPSPGQPGYSTWTNNGKGGNGSTLYGGGSFWESPLVDTARHELDRRHRQPGAVELARPRPNLYTCSIVALDLYTGQLKWYFQQVHHDMWDSDLPNNGVMFDGKFKVNGKMVTRPPSPTSTRSA